MAIEYVIEKDSDGAWLFCPRIRCDHCRLVIEDANLANVYYDPGKADTGSPALFAHKECDYAFSRSYPDVRLYWETLNVFLVHLGNNLKFERKEAEKLSATLSSIR